MKFGFLKHYRKIKIEGINLSSVINKCIKNRITLRNLRWKNDIEYTAELQGNDYNRLKKLAGHSYKMTVLKEGGVIPVFRSMKANILTVIGAFLLGALIFYQSLFIAEINIDGYRSLDEADIRATLKDAGIYEGAKKSDSYNDAKELLYETYDKLTWVSIYQEGRLLKVNVSEAGINEKTPPEDTKPVHIVASQSGIIEDIRPMQGNAKVKKGDYVNKGDVLISGKFKYQSTDYSRGDEEFIMYSHAKGTALAKIPKHITYYFDKKERVKKQTGNSFFGLSVKIGDISFDTTKGWGGYEASVKEEKVLLKTVNPIPISIKLLTVREVKLEDADKAYSSIEKVVEAALRQYEKDNLETGESIISKSVDYSESTGLIKASVMIEVLEDIGAEKEIDIEKEKKDEKKNKKEVR